MSVTEWGGPVDPPLSVRLSPRPDHAYDGLSFDEVCTVGCCTSKQKRRDGNKRLSFGRNRFIESRSRFGNIAGGVGLVDTICHSQRCFLALCVLVRVDSYSSELHSMHTLEP